MKSDIFTRQPVRKSTVGITLAQPVNVRSGNVKILFHGKWYRYKPVFQLKRTYNIIL